MVQELERSRQSGEFPENAPTAYPVFYRTYSRRTDNGRETWNAVCDRTVRGLTKLGKLFWLAGPIQVQTHLSAMLQKGVDARQLDIADTGLAC